jgi:tetratricopeptide (TPR) repeat protein
MERRFIGAAGSEFELSLVERILVAGRAIWFYIGKLICPINLTFIYPRWQIDPTAWWQYLFPAAALGLAIALWFRRQQGRGPLATFLLFCGTLFPALGFVNAYPFRYSFVADHFQYHASIAPLALAAVGVSIILNRQKVLNLRMLKPSCIVLLFGVLSILTWRQSSIFSNVESLWQTTIDRNPECWMAYHNLGEIWRGKGELDKSIQYLERSIKIKDNNAEAHNSLGLALHQKGMTDEALSHIREALRSNPNFAAAYNNLGMLLHEEGQTDAAIANFTRALELRSAFPDAPDNLGVALLQKGQPDAAIAHFQAVLRSKPDDAETECKLGLAIQQQGRITESILHYKRALELKPGYTEATANLGMALFQKGETLNAIFLIEQVLTSDPGISVTNPELVRTLSASYIRIGKYDQALAVAQRLASSQPISVK